MHRSFQTSFNIQRVQAGFTLLEVLVALGIAATSLISLYTLAAHLIDGTQALDYRQAALWCADNHLITLSLNQKAPAVGETNHLCKQLQQRFIVHRVIKSSPQPLFSRIEVSVYRNIDKGTDKNVNNKDNSDNNNDNDNQYINQTSPLDISLDIAQQERLVFLSSIIPVNTGQPSKTIIVSESN